MKKNDLDYKVAFIIVLYKTSKKEIKRLKKEIKSLGFKKYKVYFIDNTNSKLGYGSGVNIGIKKAISDGFNLFIIANHDISIKNLKFNQIIQGLNYFDILGFALKQKEKIYYGGKIDKWRLSGGLIDKKPKKRFEKVDFISGSLMIIKKNVIEKIGFFDESYFMYYEDVDFCLKAKKSGFNIGIDSELVYDHYELSNKYNFQKDKLLFENRLRFFLKYSSFKQKIREFIRLPLTVYEEIKKRIFFVNFFAYNLFSILNKILTFIQFIFLIRIFPPDIYGIYSLVWVHLGMFLPLIDFGSTNYGIINLPQEKNIKFSDVLSFRFFLSIIVFFLTLGSLFFVPYESIIKLSVIFVSIVSFQAGFFGSLLIKLTNLNKSYISSLISFIFQLILTLSIILTSFLTKDILTVFLIIFVLYGIYLIFIINYLKKIEFSLSIDFSFKKFFSIIKKSYVYLLISLFARWYSRIDIFAIQFIKGQEAVGIYSSAYKFLEALMFIITAYNLSSLPIFVSLFKEKKIDLLRLKIKRDFIFLGISGLLISFLFYFFSPMFLNFIFKNKYLSAIPVLQIIIFSLPLILLTSIFFNFFYTIGKIKIIIFLMIFQIFFNGVLNIIFVPLYGYFASAYISVLGEIINLFISIFYYKKLSLEKNWIKNL